ncbi:MAG TPA: type II secretion system protein [Verrucomicrobiae bacterium]|jgi:prepilin-type N-terminal cleavage/methylation domain-containing protein/prepilin-type processing-associated H-X9-DG protein|nr:type II secretion system protein [Verrucomicrobiae bacterium]
MNTENHQMVGTAQTGGNRIPNAFTVIELLAVITVIGVIVATLFPALANTKVQGQAFRCQNNLKQLTIAWAQYSSENNDALMDPSIWVGSNPLITMDWSSSSANTNTFPLLNGPIGAYVKAPALFKCPADKYQSPATPGPRVRSISLNGHVGGSGGVVAQDPGDGRVFFGTSGAGPSKKLSDLNKPSPARVFVLLDEQADSINDASFSTTLFFSAASEQWRDLPAGYHNGAGSFSFADGHTEIHQWQNPKLNPTIYPVAYTTANLWQLISGKSSDYEWVRDGMPYR